MMKEITVTGRERLLATFRRERPDRVPVAPFIYYNNVYELFGYQPRIVDYMDPVDFDVITQFVAYCRHYGFDVLHTLGSAWDACTLGASWDNWDVTVATEGNDDELQRVTIARTPGGTLRQIVSLKRSSPHLVVAATEEYPLKDGSDFDLYARYAPPAERLDVSLVQRARAAVGESGVVASFAQGAFNALAFLRRLDDALMDPLVDEGLYRSMISYFVDRLVGQGRKVVEAGAEVVEVGGNLATGCVGPRFFADYVLEYERQVIAGLKAAGAYVIYHNCGDADRIMHLYNDLGADCWGYLTPPPYGDVDLDKALRVMRPDLVLRGNIDQVTFLREASPAEIRARVAELLVRVKPRGHFVLSTTDFMFDGTPRENIRALADAGREFGAYD